MEMDETHKRDLKRLLVLGEEDHLPERVISLYFKVKKMLAYAAVNMKVETLVMIATLGTLAPTKEEVSKDTPLHTGLPCKAFYEGNEVDGTLVNQPEGEDYSFVAIGPNDVVKIPNHNIKVKE